jgi:hypothetical protein
MRLIIVVYPSLLVVQCMHLQWIIACFSAFRNSHPKMTLRLHRNGGAFDLCSCSAAIPVRINSAHAPAYLRISALIALSRFITSLAPRPK